MGYSQYLRFWRIKEKNARMTFHLPICPKNTNHSCIFAASVKDSLECQPDGKVRLRKKENGVSTIV